MSLNLETIELVDAALPLRVLTAFRRENIVWLGQVDRMSDADLLSLHGIGLATVRSLRATLEALRKSKRLL